LRQFWGWDNPWVVAGFGLAALLLPVLGRRSATARYPALDLSQRPGRWFSDQMASF